MIRAYKHFRRKLSFIKHEKLTEESGQDPIVEGVTFYVRYLGSCFVINKTGEEETGEAIKSIVSMARKTDRKLNRVALLISVKDVKMTDLESGDVCFDISIYRISYCCADELFSHVFAFIAVNKDETMECHAFLCRKRKIAQAASMTVAQAFNLAFVSWKDTQEKKKESVKVNENVASVPQPQQSEAGAEGEERLLIDLRSPGDSLDTGLVQELVRLEAEQREPDTEMDQSFARLTATPAMLRHLPPHAASLDVAAFASSSCSPLAEAGCSPQHGSCLTPSQLVTPASSPHSKIRQLVPALPPPSPLLRPSPL